MGNPSRLVASDEDLDGVLIALENLDGAAVVELEARLVIGRRDGAEGIGRGVGALGEAVLRVEVLDGGQVDTVCLVCLQVVIDNDAVDNSAVAPMASRRALVFSEQLS